MFDPFNDLPAAAGVPARDVEQQRKRPAEHEGGEDRESEGASPPLLQQNKKLKEGVNEKREATATVEFETATQKIVKAMQSSKKYPKAASLLQQLLEGDLQEGSRATLIHDALADLLSAEAFQSLMVEEENLDATERLFTTLQKHILCFTPIQQFRVVSWTLMGACRATLHTDDTYEFRKACRRVKECLGFLRPAEEADGPLEVERRRALLLCLATAVKRTTVAWAKPSVEDLFSTASERRLMFTEEEREELDDMVTKVHTAQRGASVNPGGTVVSRAVRLANSTSTPWNSKRTDYVKR